MAHGLGHHFLHQGNHCYLHSLWLDKQERYAEMFAAMLLVPPGVIDTRSGWKAEMIEQLFGVPKELAVMRWQTLAKAC
ncbi:MAG: ImmA/IrrE family metallo-endopeptidase [Bacillota bacterium]